MIRNFFLVFICAAGGFLFGYAIGLPGQQPELSLIGGVLTGAAGSLLVLAGSSP